MVPGCSGSPPGARPLFCRVPPARDSCHQAGLVRGGGGRSPVEGAGQRLSKDKEAIGCADRPAGHCACGFGGVVKQRE